MSSELLHTDPITLHLPPHIIPTLRPSLQLIDTSADFQLSRLRKSRPWREPQIGREEFAKQLQALEARRNRSLLFGGPNDPWTYSGLGQHLSRLLELPVKRCYDLPKPSPIPWRRTPKEFFGRELYDHQIEGAEAAIAQGHGTLDFCTGSGKTGAIALYVRQLGLRSVILVYSRVIADQITAVLTALLGEKYVGQFNGDQKQVGKLVTVCTVAAAANVKPGSKAFQWFADCQVLVLDESHLAAADILCGLATKLFRNAPYRLATSATQTRSDGLQLLLRGIVGPTLAELTFRQAVEKGLIAYPTFYTIGLDSLSEFYSKDTDRMTRAHLYENSDVGLGIGRVVQKFNQVGYSCLVLAEEFPQVAGLIKHLPEAAVLHGGTGTYSVVVNFRGAPSLKLSPGERVETDLGRMPASELLEVWGRPEKPASLCLGESEQRWVEIAQVKQTEATGQSLLPKEHRDVDPQDVVRAFNSLEKQNVISTSAGRVGVSFEPKAPMAVFYLAGGTSEIALTQGLGRGTRLKGKDHFLFFNVRIRNVEALNRHADAQNKILTELWREPEEIGLDALL